MGQRRRSAMTRNEADAAERCASAAEAKPKMRRGGETMRQRSLLLLLVLLGCDATISAPPKPPPPVDPCVDLPAISAVIVPDTIRVNGAATITAQGGSG